MDNEVIERIRRIYAAIGAVEETDLSKLKGTLVRTQSVLLVHQDFRGGLDDDQLSNLAHSLIHNIANLENHLRKWAAHNGQDINKVDKAVSRSLALQIIKDLSNNDKHGYPPRDGGHSKRCPRLVDISRVLQLATKPRAGSTVCVTLNQTGTPQATGSGSAKAIITGEIVDKDNNRIGDLHQVGTEAVEAWEHLLDDLGIKL
jgi:hypothetical protein